MNRHLYNTDERKIGYIISYMTGPAAAVWVENYLTRREGRDGYDFPTLNEFLDDLNEDFKDVEAKTDSLFQLEKIVQKGKPVEAHNENFKRHLIRARIPLPGRDDGVLLNMYLKSLDQGLLRKVMDHKPPYRDLNDAMKYALEENLEYRKYQRFQDLLGRKSTHTKESPKKKFVKYKNKAGEKKFRTIRVALDDADDEESDSQETETSETEIDVIDLKDIKCYNCEEMGHFARDCKKPQKKSSKKPFQKKSHKLAKDIRAMDPEEQDELLHQLEETGF